MVKRVLYLVAAFVLACCSSDAPVPSNGKVLFSFSLDCGGFTKAIDENLIGDLNLYIFNTAGGIVAHSYIAGGGEVSVDIWSGESYTVYAVANAGCSLPVKNCSELENLSISVSCADGCAVMTGSLLPQVIENGDRITIPLTRAIAQVTLKADYSALNSDVSIQVNRITLKNVPGRLKLFDKSAFDDASLFADGESVENPAQEQLQEGISFCQYENMQGTLLPGNVDQKQKVWPLDNNYSKVCSYVELQASYTSQSLEGDIIYRFYLGSDMVSNYDVERNRQYDISVSFKGNGGADETSWRVDNSGLEDVVPPEISFGDSAVEMYDLEVVELPFSKLDARGGEVDVVSSDPSVLQVLEWNGEYVKVMALAPGEATVEASVKGVSASCSVKVEKLRLVPASSSITLFNHFYEDIEYDIYPAHAAGLEVEVTSPSVSVVAGFGGRQNRIIPQYSGSNTFPLQETAIISIVGREDVYAEVSLDIHPMISAAQEVVLKANYGNSQTIKSIGLETSSRADVKFEWMPTDGQTIYGTPPSSISYTKESIVAQIPTEANGRYRMKLSVVGDDGYGSDSSEQNDAVAYCDLLVYETIYLVGVSKSMSRERVSVSPDVWKYENEVVAKWLSHPNSLLFPNGELDLCFQFLYKGALHNDNHTEFYQAYEFTFREGESYDYSMGNGYFVYNGTAPLYYYEYFFLQPIGSPYIEGSLPDNEPFIFVCSRNFAGGFWKEDIPDWRSVFEYIYPAE